MAIPDLRKLKNAVVLADAGSFVRASEQLHLTQSALTRSMQALETELGIRLFDRTKQGVRPTPDGEQVLTRARLLLLQARTLEREVALIRRAELGSIAFGVGPAMPSIFLPELLLELVTEFPTLSADVHVEAGQRLLQMLRDEQIEFFVAGVTQLEGLDPEIFAVLPLAEISTQFFVHSTHPLARNSSVTRDDLMQFPLVSPSPLQGQISLAADRLGRSRLRCNDVASLLALVLGSDAVLLGIREMFEQELVDGILLQLPLVSPLLRTHSKVALVSLSGRTPSRAHELISERLRQRLPASVGASRNKPATPPSPRHSTTPPHLPSE